MHKPVLFLLLLFSLTGFGQSFTAVTEEMFLGVTETDINGAITVLSGVLKKSDKLDIYAETGLKFTASIVKITGKGSQEVSQVKPGEFAFFELKFSQSPSSGSDYLRKGYRVYPMGFKPAAVAAPAAETKTTLTSRLDGKPWKANVTYKGAALWRKGVKNFVEKPYLQLQFASVQSPDNRLLTIQVFYPKEAPAAYTASGMEVNFSGATDGKKENTTIFGFVNGRSAPDFRLNITKWQASGDSKAVISGTLDGYLPEVKLLGRSTQRVQFENGVFENVTVELFSEQPDMKELMKKAGQKN